jgi:hypothetical protein
VRHPLSRHVAIVLALGIAAAACGPAPSPDPAAQAVPGEVPAPTERAARPTPAPPEPGHELYGYLPYWEMRGDIADHLAETPLTTLALFSVTHTNRGLDAGKRGYELVTGDLGRRLVREAHERGTRVELVYTSFGAKRNRNLLTNEARQGRVIEALVELAGELGMDGVNVDIEALDPTLVPAYAGFVERLRTAIRAADPDDQVSVATGAGPLGAAMAVAADGAGADRIFLMGYDYRVAASSPGASAPLERSDGGQRDLRWSLDLYGTLGVPPGKLLLGLPLYGMTWPVAAPVIGAPETGRGDAWIPRLHRPLLTDEAIEPERDEVEQVDVYFEASDGTVGAPAPGASLAPDELERTWTAVYVDSPETLAPKMALANERGLAGSGFWAIGYERGLPGYRELMATFVAGAEVP